MKVKTHTFNGRKYKIEYCPGGIDGLTDQNEGLPNLLILRELNTQAGIITAIHEALHACSWSSTETTVDKTSKDIGRLLWRLGLRFKEE